MCTTTKDKNVDIKTKTDIINMNEITRTSLKTPTLPVKNMASYASAVHKKGLAIADSGTTGHFLQIQSECIDKRPTMEGVKVKLPDGGIITSTHTALLNLPQLPMKARRAHIFPDIKHSLISINMLCEEGYMAIFDENNVYIVKDSEVILHGYKDDNKDSNERLVT